jgi:hypothetical protein
MVEVGSGRIQAIVAAVLASVAALGGCSSDVAPYRDSTEESPPRPPPLLLRPEPKEDPELGDPGPTPKACVAHPVTGAGTTWLESTLASGGQRHLRCLSHGTAALSGRFVHTVHETNLPNIAGTYVEEADRIYDYPVHDRLANQPAVYYVVTQMALAQQAADDALSLPPVEVFTGPFFLFDSFYTGEGLTLGRAGLSGSRLDVDITAHEYGHHVVATLAPALHLSTLHEGMADFLSCAFRGDAAFMDSLPAPLQRPCDNDSAWPFDAYDTQQACALLAAGFKDAGWDQEYEEEYDTVQACLAAPGPHLLEGHLTGMIVSGALWSLHVDLGPATFMPLFLEALRQLPDDVPGDFGMLGTALLAADAAIYDGAHSAKIQLELEQRGMTADVGIATHEEGIGYACLYTPEHAAKGLVPAGPLLPAARPRRASR